MGMGGGTEGGEGYDFVPVGRIHWNMLCDILNRLGVTHQCESVTDRLLVAW